MQRVLPAMAAFLLFAASLGAAPANSAPAAEANPPKKAESPARPFQVGAASWYGKRFHGRTTANGETYDMFQFTAAHRTLPLGTWVKVTNVKNGRWVVVRVNDRGPYVGRRVIDLSYAAAQMLGLRHRGIGTVKLEILQPEAVAAYRTPAGTPGGQSSENVSLD